MSGYRYFNARIRNAARYGCAALALAIAGNAASAQALFFQGLSNTSLGNASVTVEAGKLVVRNIGSTGGDGVSVDLTEAGFGITTYQEFPTGLPDGAYVRFAARGRLNGVANQLLGSVTATAVNGNGTTDYTVNFDPLGSTTQKVEVFNGNTRVFSRSGLTLPPIRIPRPICDPVDPIWPMDNGPILAIVSTGEVGSIIVDGITVTGNRVEVTAENTTAQIGSVNRINITGGGGLTTFTILNEKLGLFHNPHNARGGARLSATSAGSLTVSNIGSTGADGVTIDLESAHGLDLFLQPVNLGATGSLMRLGATGNLNGNPKADLGFARISNSSGNLALFTDYSPVGATQTRVEVLKNGEIIGVITVPSGNIGRLQGLTPRLSGCGKVNLPDPPTTLCIWVEFDRDFTYRAPNGATFVGNRLNLLSANATAQVNGLTSYSLNGANVGGSFTISDEQIPGQGPALGVPDEPVAGLSGLAAIPNITGGETSISYELSRPGDVRLGLYDATGNLVATLDEGMKNAGGHTVRWDSRPVPVGAYYLRLSTGAQVLTARVTVMR